MALLGKWWWRFRKEGGRLWVRVIKSIYSECGGLGVIVNEVGGGRGDVGYGRDIRFWVDRWINNRDRWRRTLSEDDDFKVKELTRLIKEKALQVESGSQETLWNSLVMCDLAMSVWEKVFSGGRWGTLMLSLLTSFSDHMGTLISLLGSLVCGKRYFGQLGSRA
nr:hypothetical protein [Tanacetum cinerariifolium]